MSLALPWALPFPLVCVCVRGVRSGWVTRPCIYAPVLGLSCVVKEGISVPRLVAGVVRVAALRDEARLVHVSPSLCISSGTG